MRRFTREERDNCLRLLNEGKSQQEIADFYHVHRSRISRLQSRFQMTGSHDYYYGVGRGNCKIDIRSQRTLLRFARQNRTKCSRILNENLRRETSIRVSDRAIRKSLNKNNLRARRRAKSTRLLQFHRTARLAWVQQYQHWGHPDWMHCMFADETRFNLFHSDGRILVWREPNQRYEEENMAPQEAFGGGGVTVWAGVMYNGKTELYITRHTVNAETYRDDIILPIVVPFAENYGPDFVLIDDNARPHRARIVTEVLQANNINRMDWPAKSPDLNIIEHVWSRLKLAVRSRDNSPQTLDELS